MRRTTFLRGISGVSRQIRRGRPHMAPRLSVAAGAPASALPRQPTMAAIPVPRQPTKVRPSLFDAELRSSSDSKALLKSAVRTKLPLGPADISALFARLKVLGDVPRGGDMHKLVDRVKEMLPKCSPEDVLSILNSFSHLRNRAGALAVWPFLISHLGSLSTPHRAESVWSASVLPDPPPELRRDVVGIANGLSLRELPDMVALYRVIYSLARLSCKRCDGFRLRAEKTIAAQLMVPGPSPLSPTQLVRLAWALVRLGSRGDGSGKNAHGFFYALELRSEGLWGELTDRELEALYRLLTGIGCSAQWRFIHDIERCMAGRKDSAPPDPNKAPRKGGYKKKWRRATIDDNPMRKGKASRTRQTRLRPAT